MFLKNIYDSKFGYSITCIQRPLKESNESGPLQQVVFKYRFFQVELRRVVVSEHWSLKVGGLLIQVVSNTGLTVVSIKKSQSLMLLTTKVSP